MFDTAIKKNSKYTYPIIVGFSKYNNPNIEYNIATMININKEGYFLTCKHVANLLKEYFEFQKEQQKINNIINEANKLSKKSQEKYLKDNNINNNTIVEYGIIFPFKINNGIKVQIIEHKKLDLAVIHFENVTTNLKEYPKFSKESPKPGKMICKLGYAFPTGAPFIIENNHLRISNYNNFEYPLFPYDGMITRNINLNIDNTIFPNAAFETSTAGLKGQSGGPIFDPSGTIYGIQSMNVTMPLDTVGITINNQEKIISPQFINFGVGISSQEITKFLEENKIKYK